MTALAAPFVRGRAVAARWERPALVGLLAATAVLYLVNLSVSGWANSFYSAAVQAGSVDWTAFFYGSSDAANSITVDKPPASLWIMALSARLFGLSPWSILAPEALMGVATVGVLYATVRRRFGAATGLLAGGILAITPVAALMFRYNNPDALLVLLTALAVYFVLRGVETGALKWVLWAGVMIGFAFLTKQLQAFLVLPVLAGVYLYGAPLRFVTRLWHAAAALGAVLVSAGWWVAVVQLVPASLRPYVGGSQSNSFLELTFGYNGLGRLTGQETGSVTSGGKAVWGGTGILRLVSGDVAGQIAWLLPAALVLFVAALVLLRRLPRTSPTRAAVLLLGGSLVVTALAFSFMAGIFHAYYTVALAPPLAGTVAIGVGMLWARRARLSARITLAALVFASGALAWAILALAPDWLPWLRPAILCVALVAAALLLVLPHLGVRVGALAASAALLAVLAAPLSYTLQSVTVAHTGSIVTAGPGVSGFGLFGGRPAALGAHATAPALGAHATAPALGAQAPGAPAALGTHRAQGLGTPRPATQATTTPLRPGTKSPLASSLSVGGLLNASAVSPQMVDILTADSDSYTWVAAAIGSQVAAGYQLATRDPVMPIGGFNGSDPSPTLAQFTALVAQHRIHWFIASATGRANGGSRDSAAISAWVVANYTPTTVGFTRIYDLTP